VLPIAFNGTLKLINCVCDDVVLYGTFIINNEIKLSIAKLKLFVDTIDKPLIVCPDVNPNIFCAKTPPVIIIVVDDASDIVIFCVVNDAVKVGIIGNVLKAVVSAAHKSFIEVDI